MADASAVAKPVDKEISISCESEFKQYPFSKAEDVWALVTLTAPCHQDENTRAPIDLVAVIDKSGSMNGAKLALVKTTLEFMLQQMRDDDRLSVVTYDTHVAVDIHLMRMTKKNKVICLTKIRKINSGSSTNLSGGLLKGLDQVASRTGDKNDVASVLLFTDGLANHGVTSTVGIVAAMKDPRMYQSVEQHRDPPKHHSWLQKLTGRGPTEHAEKDTSSTPKPSAEQRIPASVYTFGFGADHDPSMLKAISDAGNGMYYFIENEDKIAESFGHCFGGLLSTVGQGIQLSIVTQEGVKIKEVHSNRPFTSADDKKSVKVDMGDLQSEESRDVVLQISIDALSAEREETDPQPLFGADVTYFNVINARLGSVSTTLSVLRTGIAENNPENGSLALNMQRDRIETTNAIRRATEFADDDNYEGAYEAMQDQLQSNLMRNYADHSFMACLNDDIKTFSNELKSKSAWKKKGKKMAMNMAQMHEQQRSSETTSNDRYHSEAKGSMALKFKSAAKK